MKKNKLKLKDFGWVPDDFPEDIVPGDAFIVILDDLNSREEPKHNSGVFSFLKSLKLRGEK